MRNFGLERKPSSYTYFCLGVIILFLAVYCLVRPSTTWSLAGLALLSFIYPLKDRMKDIEKSIWALLSLVFIFGLARGLSKERKDYNTAQITIANHFEETNGRVETAIKQERRQFLQTMNRFSQTTKRLGNIANLEHENLNTVTGGKSFCYALALSAPYRKGAILFFVQSGKYPLSDVNARVFDVDAFEAAAKRPGGITLDNLMTGSTNIYLGDMAVHSGSKMYEFPIPGRVRRFNIMFQAKNGHWIELLRLRLINGAWVSAIKVTTEGKKQRVLFEKVDPKFPKNRNGKVKW